MLSFASGESGPSESDCNSGETDSRLDRYDY